MVAKVNANTSTGLQLESDLSGTLELQSAGNTKAVVSSTGLNVTADTMVVGSVTETQTTKSGSFTPNLDTEGTVYSCSGGSAPTAAAAIEIYVFYSDGTNWYGMQSGTGFA